MSILVFDECLSAVTKEALLYSASADQIKFVNNNDGLNILQALCFNLDLSPTQVFISIYNKKACDSLLNILIDPDTLVKPIVVLISTLETWTRNSVEVVNVIESFENRLPNLSTFDAYNTENVFWQNSKLYEYSLKIIHLGLVYGGPGYDFADIYKSIWKLEPLTIQCSNGLSSPPMIHYLDLYSKVLNIVQQNYSLLESKQLSREIIICADSNADTIETIVTQLYIRINDCSPSINYSSNEGTIWNSIFKLVAPQDEMNYSRKIIDETMSTWSEYVFTFANSYQNILVVGGPKSGKSSLCQALASEYNLTVLSISESVKFVLRMQPTLFSNTIAYPHAWEPEQIINATQAVYNAVRAKHLEGKKIKKGEENNPIDIDSVVVDETLCKGLPSEIVYTSIKAYVSHNCLISRLGYVYELPDDILNIEGIMNISNSYPTSVIEIDEDPTVILKRFVQHAGYETGKLSKEAQAAIKNVEQQLTQYKAKLITLEDKSLSHPVVDGLKGIGIAITRARGSIAEILSIHKEKSKKTTTTEEIIETSLCTDFNVEASTESNDSVQESDVAMSDALQQRIVELEEYVVDNVLPMVVQAMINIRREKPDDPIMFMVRHLEEEAGIAEHSAESEAFRVFKALLSGDTEESLPL